MSHQGDEDNQSEPHAPDLPPTGPVADLNVPGPHGGLTEAHRPQRGVRPHEPHPTPFHSRGGSKASPTGPTPITILRMVPVNVLSYAL